MLKHTPLLHYSDLLRVDVRVNATKDDFHANLSGGVSDSAIVINKTTGRLPFSVVRGFALEQCQKLIATSALPMSQDLFNLMLIAKFAKNRSRLVRL
jgi:hypothetical protein